MAGDIAAARGKREVRKAMMLTGLGLLSAPLYLVSQFFEGQASEQLLGIGISADHLQDNRLEQALAHFYDSYNAIALSVLSIPSFATGGRTKANQ